MEELRDGRLVYPFAFLTSKQGQFAVSALYSDDDGKSWRRSVSVLEAGGAGYESGASEPTVVELADKRLLMLIRAQSGFLWRSYSRDRGQTWSPAEPSRLPSSNSPATALRLRSGKIAVAWNHHVDGNYARQSLVLGITPDGEEFECLRELDGTDFPDNPAEPVQHTTYPYLTEPREGLVAVSYNKGTWTGHNRPALALTSAAWLRATEETVDFADGRVGWHTVNPGPNRRAAVGEVRRRGRSQSRRITRDRAGQGHRGARGHQPESGAGAQRVDSRHGDGDKAGSLPPAARHAAHSGRDGRRVPAASLRKRRGDLCGRGQSTRTSRGTRRTTKFSYVRHAVESEQKHPAGFTAGRRMT